MSENSVQAVSPTPLEFPIGQNLRVLHSLFGVGHVTGSRDHLVTVCFDSGARDVPADTLRQVVPVTELARKIESTSQVSAWAVRKAHEEHRIEPDAIGKFAGHRIHYYDATRIPELTRELLQPEHWPVAARVIHPQFGPGVITGYGPQSNAGLSCPLRVVQFYATGSEMSVSTADLRRLVPGTAVAEAVGAGRKAFRKLAASRGIYPDYVAPQPRVREYYDESRLPAIVCHWSGAEIQEALPSGRVVLGPDGQPATILRKDAIGRILIRCVSSPCLLQWCDRNQVRELVSLRELARRQKFSRYKVRRLLDTAGITPVYQDGKTLYFDRVSAEQSLCERLRDEHNAVALRTLAGETRQSVAVLARKVGAGCIQTLRHGSGHYVCAGEAERIRQVIRALRSADSIHELGICRTHQRGRAGREVSAWDIYALLRATRDVSPEKRQILCGQIAWFADGTGRTRLREALDGYLESLQVADTDGARHAADCLLSLLDVLPADFSQYRIRLILLATGGIREYLRYEDRIRRLAILAGCEGRRSVQRFRSRIDQQLLAVALQQRGDVHAVPDECGPGAVLIAVSDGKPDVGVITRIEKQCWNAVAGCWHKTAVVRFGTDERSMRVDGQLTARAAPLLVLMSASEVAKLASLLNGRNAAAGVSLQRTLLKLAS